MRPRITLRDALAQADSRGVQLSSYESYRQDAHTRGYILIGGRTIATTKVGRSWTVDAEEFAAAIEAACTHQAVEQRKIAEADGDYEAHRLDPSGRGRLSWGSYYVHGSFHFVSIDYARMRMRSNGGWRCNTCWEPASTEHNKPECYRCSDWSPCDADCTLSRIYCKNCGTSLSMGNS